MKNNILFSMIALLLVGLVTNQTQAQTGEIVPYVATSMGIGLNKQSVANALEAGVEIETGTGYLVIAGEYRANWLNVLQDGIGGKIGYRVNTDFDNRTFEKGWAFFIGAYQPVAEGKTYTQAVKPMYGIRRNHNGIAYTEVTYWNKTVSLTVGILFSKYSVRNSIF